MATMWKELPDAPKVPLRLPNENQGIDHLCNKIKLKTNYFTVKYEKPGVILYHYDVKIEEWHKDILSQGDAGATAQTGLENAEHDSSLQASSSAESPEFKRAIPKSKKRKIFLQFKEELEKVFSDCHMAYDGEASAYSCMNIKEFNHQFQFVDETNQRKQMFQVKVKFVKRYSLRTLLKSLPKLKPLSENCLSIFQALQVMINYERTVKYATVGYNRFFSHTREDFGKNFAVGDTKEGVAGFFCSLRPVAGWKDATLLLNIDIAHTTFYRPISLFEFFGKQEANLDSGSVLDNDSIRKIKNEIIKKDVRVEVTHSFKRKYKVTGVSLNTPLTQKFEHNGKTVNMVEYFKERYKYDIKYKHMQCLEVGKADRLMPIELCKIAPNQHVKKQLEGLESKQFVKQTAVMPHRRLRQIEDIIEKKEFSLDPMLESLGITISERVDVTGGVLQPPTVAVRDKTVREKSITPRQGVWDTRDDSFYNPGVPLTSWAVVCFCSNANGVNEFIKAVVRMGRWRSMEIEEPCVVNLRGDAFNPGDTLCKIKFHYPDVMLIMCIITKSQYERIKAIGDRELRVPTQCVLLPNVQKREPATIGNILLKMNAKLEGINHISYYPSKLADFGKMFKDPVIVMGADVNHPAAGDHTRPSLASVVGSLDGHATRYACETRCQQRSKDDLINDMTGITKNLLKQFYMSNKGVKPQRIIMYRDGVSETQFQQVLNKEMRAMRDACSDLQRDYEPAITFICVQKRHHTRLFCADEKADGDPKTGNVPPGTVVDNTITHRTEADFFLCSHKGIQGTSKPTHYHVLWDDSDFTLVQLQLLTYSLCHNYARCNRAVSIPTPVYYAHHAAFRAKSHLEGYRLNNPDRAYSDDMLKDATWVEKDMKLPSMYFL